MELTGSAPPTPGVQTGYPKGVVCGGEGQAEDFPKETALPRWVPLPDQVPKPVCLPWPGSDLGDEHGVPGAA